MFIRSERLILDHLKSSDVESFFEITHNPQVKKYVRYAYSETLCDAKKTLHTYTKYDDVNDYSVAIRANINTECYEKAELIGVLLFNRIGVCYEVCYFVKESMQSKGYCTEALKLFIQYLRNNDLYLKLFFEVAKSNAPSRKVLENLGFVTGDEQDFFYQV